MVINGRATHSENRAADSKLQKLLDVVLRDLLLLDPKVVVFTRYVDTMEYLAEQIEGDERYAKATVLTIHGGLNERQRREIFHAFERAEVGILVATDAISEGINLQHAAAQVVHYELLWNPNRLEQRNGRVDRFGQRRPVVRIRTMVMDETLDTTILQVLVKKAAQIRQDYGFSPPYFGDETLERIREDSFYGQTHISLPEIEQRLEETAATVGEVIPRTTGEVQEALAGTPSIGFSRSNSASLTIYDSLETPPFLVVPRTVDRQANKKAP